MRARAVAAVIAALGVLGGGAPAAGAAARSPAAATAAATAYLLSAQNRDGGFGPAPGQGSDPLFTGWAALGLASAGRNLNALSRGGAGLMAYMARAARASDPGSLERTILVLSAAGRSARRFAGRDLVAALQRHIAATGAVSDQVNLTSFAILALRGAGAAPGVLARSRAWLARQPDRDGGFNFATAGGTSDVDDTGAALEALAGDPGAAAVRARAVAYLRRQQDRDGGFPSQPGSGSNAPSTAWAIQGLDAAGVAPQTLHRGGAPSPLAYLDGLQAPSGLVRYARGTVQTPVWVTGEALMAMEGAPLPIAAPAAPRAPAGAGGPALPGLSPASTGRLAAAAGVLAALVLAPVGLG